jgi:uncharacterized protein (DUF885 family)
MAITISQLTKRYLDEYADFQPVSATAMGMKGQEKRLPDLSESRIRSYLKVLREIKKDLKSLSIPLSLKTERIEVALLKSELRLRDDEWGLVKKYRKDPSLYVGELVYGLWYLLLRVPSKTLKVEGCIQRLLQSRSILNSAQQNLDRPPRLWTQIAIEEAKGYLEFLQEVRRELLRLAPYRAAKIKTAVAQADAVGRELLHFLRGPLLKRSNGHFCVGEKRFNFLLKNYHHYSLDAEKLSKIGKKQFAEIRRALQAQANKIEPGVPWHRLVNKFKKDFPPQKKLLQVYKNETKRLRRFVADHAIVRLPKGEKLRVVETPVFTRNTIPYAAYVDPPMFSGKNHGTFFVTPVTTRDKRRAQEVLEEHNYSSMRVTALHEGYPGHHLQFATQRYASGNMMKTYQCSSFYEGWALYCEEMMYEAGYYDGAGRLMQLRDKLWRACRVIIDVGLHTGKMTDDEAVQFMVRELKMSRLAARADVNWYTQRPTVPQSYLTGMLQIRKLRQRYQKKLGKDFTLKKFHNAVLQFGAIPIPLVAKALLEK